MSVAETVILPNQPVSGLIEEVALNGDGYSSPHSATYGRVNLAADAGAGTLQVTVEMDPRWTSMVSFMEVEVASMANDKNVNMRILITPTLAMGHNATIVLPFSGSATFNLLTWWPAPQLIFSPHHTGGAGSSRSNIRVTTDNTDTEDINFHFVLYNFKKDVQKQMPAWISHRVLTRGSST